MSGIHNSKFLKCIDLNTVAHILYLNAVSPLKQSWTIRAHCRLHKSCFSLTGNRTRAAAVRAPNPSH